MPDQKSRKAKKKQEQQDKENTIPPKKPDIPHTIESDTEEEDQEQELWTPGFGMSSDDDDLTFEEEVGRIFRQLRRLELEENSRQIAQQAEEEVAMQEKEVKNKEK